MAYDRDMELVLRVRQAARKLSIASKWIDSGENFKIEDSFIYEMYVLFCLIEDLARNYQIEYDAGMGEKAHEFPRAPAKKQGRPKFIIKEKKKGEIVFQICAGTKVKDKYHRFRAPDISFQKAKTGDNPDFRNLALVWDAKYKIDNRKRISDSEFAKFSRLILMFKLQLSSAPIIKLDSLNGMEGNCLVTNGRQTTESDKARKSEHIKEVCRFYPDKSHKIFPIQKNK